VMIASLHMKEQAVDKTRCFRPSLRANGSRECAPDDRLREAIQSMDTTVLDCFVASFLAMTTNTSPA
jgi:hypothetical protein